MSGSVNLEGALTVRALRASEQSQYQLIIEMVARARREKPPIQRIADRFAVWFTPVTLAMCGVAYLVTHNPSSVLAVLVVATPCPLILAAPVAVIAAISRAAAQGIIVKTGAAIEQVGRARVVVFDKTGTLTLGRPLVEDVSAADGNAPEEVLRLAAAVEQLSAHHLGHAVAEAGRRRGLEVPPAEAVQETPGLGVSGRVEGQAVAVGSAAYLASRGIPVTDGAADRTTAFVAIDGRLAGAITFADRLRPQVPALMRRLTELGVTDTVMLTGDRQKSADSIAAQAGIRTVRANLLPADKVAAVQELKRLHRDVVMVGDGINDAPALAAASVGIAMGTGTDVAIESAGITLVGGDLAGIVRARRLSRATMRNIRQNLFLAFVYNAVGVPVAAGVLYPFTGVLISPIWASAAMTFSSVSVIANALRLRRVDL
jgi:Cu+-exporting ATPase